MTAKAKHRRPKTSSLVRRLVAIGTGGAALTLPLVGATTAEAAPSAQHAIAAHASAPTTATHERTPAIYSVVAGDSLFKIAGEHSLRGGWQKLYRDNRRAVGDNPSLIHVGLKLGTSSCARTLSASSRLRGAAHRPGGRPPVCLFPHGPAVRSLGAGRWGGSRCGTVPPCDSEVRWGWAAVFRRGGGGDLAAFVPPGTS